MLGSLFTVYLDSVCELYALDKMELQIDKHTYFPCNRYTYANATVNFVDFSISNYRLCLFDRVMAVKSSFSVIFLHVGALFNQRVG